MTRRHVPPDLEPLLVAGRLSQSCEPCGITEAAGFYCSRCSRQTGPSDWFRGERSEAQLEASRAASHRRAQRAAELKETAESGVLA